MKKLVIFCIGSLFAFPGVTFADARLDYNAQCASCHGANAVADWEKAKAMKVDLKKISLRVSLMSKAEMTEIIKSGKGIMPSFKSELTGDRISAIIDYVIGFRVSEPKKGSLSIPIVGGAQKDRSAMSV